MSRTPRFDVDKMRDDMAAKGLQATDLARRADVAASTVGRFLNGEIQTARTGKRLAEALGYSIRRYLISSRAAA